MTQTGPVARLSLFGLTGFAAAILVAGLGTPGYSHRSEAISALGALDAGAPNVMKVGFLFLSAGLLSAGIVLARALRGKAGLAGAVLVLVAGVATIGEAFAREDCSNLKAACAARESANTVSGHHVAHELIGLVMFVALVVGLFLLAAGLRRTAGQRTLAVPTRVAAVTALGLMVWLGSEQYGDNGGLVQRAFVAVACGWPVLLAVRLDRATRSAVLGRDLGHGGAEPVGRATKLFDPAMPPEAAHQPR
jgi:hypothetical membrane protein